MRRLLLLVGLITVAIAAMAAMASARTETRFSVVHSDSKEGHPAGHNTFIQRGRLRSPVTNRVVGHDVIKAKLLPRRNAVRIRIVSRFRGQGSLKALGVVSARHNPSRIPIIGGTGAFNGAAGKLKARGLSTFRGGGVNKTLFTFIFVQ